VVEKRQNLVNVLCERPLVRIKFGTCVNKTKSKFFYTMYLYTFLKSQPHSTLPNDIARQKIMKTISVELTYQEKIGFTYPYFNTTCHFKSCTYIDKHILV